MSVNVNITEKERLVISEALCKCIDIISITPEPWKDEARAEEMAKLVHDKFPTYLLVREEITKLREMEVAHDNKINGKLKQAGEGYTTAEAAGYDYDHYGDGTREVWEASSEGMLTAEEDGNAEEETEGGSNEAKP